MSVTTWGRCLHGLHSARIVLEVSRYWGEDLDCRWKCDPHYKKKRTLAKQPPNMLENSSFHYIVALILIAKYYRLRAFSGQNENARSKLRNRSKRAHHSGRSVVRRKSSTAWGHSISCTYNYSRTFLRRVCKYNYYQTRYAFDKSDWRHFKMAASLDTHYTTYARINTLKQV